ncbi:MAG: hypothetical protein FJ087_04780 [Deltaproteobacteria bacterium]|nr:hypothetical protein [Deltaproteobacteria bacterium]
MQDGPGSRRQRKRVTAAGVRRLAGLAEWDPAATPRVSAGERAREVFQSERSGRAYEVAEKCAACAAARRATGDPTALCEAHLAEAMGL